jgi:CheY-like chemotaxis protein
MMVQSENFYRSAFIVDSDSLSRTKLECAIRKEFPLIPVDLFSNGIELILRLEHCAEKIPGLILMELKMPLMGGIETLKWIRKNKYYSTVPVIIFSSSSAESDINRCYQLGANSYIIKPFTNIYDHVVSGLKRFL